MKIIQLKEIITLFILSLSLFFSSINSLPVLDRDEARYAQSSKQMIENNDYFSIKFQNEYRSKKPIGIYWLQAISINLLANIRHVNDFKYEVLNDNIWKYRLVSAMAIFFSIFFLYFSTKNIFQKEVAFKSCLILAGSLLVIAESHIAKTDSVLLLLSTIIFITLLKYYMRVDNKSTLNFFLLWCSLGISILIKGPLLLILLLITVILISLIEKDISWIKGSKPLLGVLFVLIIGLSWFFLLSVDEQKSFIQEAFFHDFLGKAVKVQESHGFFPGFYLLGLWIFFSPFSIFFMPLINFIKISYKKKIILFLICWFLPCLIIMELIPTKLPHYILPVYPAIAIVMGLLLSDITKNKRFFYNKLSYLGYFIYFLISNTLIILVLKANQVYGEVNFTSIIYYSVLLFCNNIVFIFILKKQIRNAFYFLVIYSSIFSTIIYLLILPNLTLLWTSKNIAAYLKKNDYVENKSSIAALGYNEPSLVFEVGTQLKVFNNIENLNTNYRKFDYLLIEKNYYIKFNEIVKDAYLSYTIIKNVKGYNASKGKWVEVYLLKKL